MTPQDYHGKIKRLKIKLMNLKTFFLEREDNKCRNEVILDTYKYNKYLINIHTVI